MAQTSQHIAQIPQAVSIAASPDPSISPQLRQEAIEYLNKVKVLSEETWQVSADGGNQETASDLTLFGVTPVINGEGLLCAVYPRSRSHRSIANRTRRQGKAVT